LLVYAQMSLTGREQIDLQQFRKTHPNFPDEPITNQFFSHGQIESYRQLGFHIGKVVCREVRARPDVEGNRPDRYQIEDDLVGYQEYYCVGCADVGALRPESAAQAESNAAESDATQRGERPVERREMSSALRQATCLLEAWRSPWFRTTPRRRPDPIFEYERNPVVETLCVLLLFAVVSDGGELTKCRCRNLFWPARLTRDWSRRDFWPGAGRFCSATCRALRPSWRCPHSTTTRKALPCGCIGGLPDRSSWS
jgi:hypothetical protein